MRLLRCAALLALLPALLPQAAQATERILNFNADINIAADGSQRVTETIQAVAEGNVIKRGIYRDLPTRYMGDLRVISVERDGWPERNHQENIANGVRIYIGDPQANVPVGTHVWVITYQTSGQLGHFDAMDELYWNVTGNAWTLPIDHASARIELPQPVAKEQLKPYAYTGRQGSKGGAWRYSLPAAGVARYSTTAPLKPGEGLTVVLSFPKGVVREPPPPAKQAVTPAGPQFEFGAAMTAAIGLLLAGFCHFMFWLLVGRDKPPGSVFPRYTPPRDYSPAELRYLQNLEYDNKCFSADLVSLASSGALAFSQDDDGDTWSVRPSTQGRPATTVAAALLHGLGNFGLSFKSEFHERIQKARETHGEAIERRIAGHKLHMFNAGAHLIGMLVSAVAMIIAINLGGPVNGPWVTSVIYFAGWIVAQIIVSLWLKRVAYLRRQRKSFSLLISVLIFGAMLLGLVSILWILLELQISSPVFIAASIGVIAVNILFGVIMPAYSASGRALLDEIAGLRLYLSVAEKADLKNIPAPPLTVDHYQSLLAYAMALDVEQAWARRLTAAVGVAAVQQMRETSYAHVPDYTSFPSFTDSVSQFATAESGSEPGSSSGSDGGGSAGGGGGGGGGGGW